MRPRPANGLGKGSAAAAARSPRTAADPLALGVGLIAVAYGAAAAIHRAWLCDDAFISFRYAENLGRGLGLVYNAGERVEGYSNFLWTLWIALGMRLGVAPEAWAVAWGVLFYVATLALLLADSVWPDRAWSVEPAAHARAAPHGGPRVPLACLFAAAHPDWQTYATSGLETSLFTFLATAGFLLVVRRSWGPRGLAGAGLAFALAALARPDGPLFVPFAALWVLACRRPRSACVAAFLGVFLIAWAPYAIWKVTYYGDFLPNTYYAKSANLAWYSQGWTYVGLYFRQYWALALAVPVGLLAWFVARRHRDRPDDLVLALLLGVVYTAYVLRVGGDFMYARLLIPAAPFLTIALARGLDLLLARRPAARWGAAAAGVAAVALTPIPLRGAEITSGVVNEPRVYRREVRERARREGLTLRPYFDGLPVRIAIVGSQAALAYYARPAVVIESGAGLTDRWIARQPLARRGRVGHEKVATVSYLLRRGVHFTIRHFAAVTLGLDAHLPVAAVAFDTIPGRLVHWDPALMDSLRRRGARFGDVPAALDAYLGTLDRLGDEQVRNDYARIKAFYFDFVADPARELAFRERLTRAEGRGP